MKKALGQVNLSQNVWWVGRGPGRNEYITTMSCPRALRMLIHELSNYVMVNLNSDALN